MENTNTSLLNLQEKLKEIFEINNSDLDFGIYRIMKFREKEIKNFIDIELPKTIDSKFKSLESSSKNIFDKVLEFEEASENDSLVELYNSGNTTEIESASKYNPKFKEYVSNKNSLKDSKKTSIESDDIYNWLNAFFTSYYDKGDFFKTRKQKGTYKFEGGDVGFTWATEGQYYIKSGKHFNNYTFLLNDDKKTKITFELLETKEAINNNKDKCKLIFGGTKDVIDEETGEIIESFTNIQIKDNEIVLFFEYKEGENKNTTDVILEVISKSPFAILTKFLTDKKTEKTKVLDYHLTRFEAESKRDFFIHKDLKGFLNTELEDFINRVIGEKQTAILGNVNLATEILKKLQVMREVSETIIDFIAGVEEYQKAIFEKKKFVVESEYCMTLDKVSKEFYDEIVKNKEQVEEWKNLGFIDDKTKLDKAYLEANNTLVLDTKFFPTLKSKILASFENLDEETNGLLINSENFQALNLMLEKYRGKVKCIYIDPPYNTGNDGFAYKDSFKHSSWLSMMENRLNLAKNFLSEDGVIIISIGRQEQERLQVLCNEIFPYSDEQDKLLVSWQTAFGGGQSNKNNYENILVYTKSGNFIFNGTKKQERQIRIIHGWKEDINSNISLKIRLNYSHIKKLLFIIIKDKINDNEIKVYYENKEQFELRLKELGVDKIKDYEKIIKCFDDYSENIKGETIGKKFGEGKYYTYRGLDEGYLYESVMEKKVNAILNRKGSLFSNIIHGDKYKEIYSSSGKNELLALVGDNDFETVKPEKLLLEMLGLNISDGLVLDFFMGSGTSIGVSHKLGKRYIGVEMGGYFENLSLIRMKKVLFGEQGGISSDEDVNWEGGGMFEYKKLEQYEDSLNNLQEPQKLENQAFLNTELNKIVYELNNNETSSISILNDDSFIKNPFSQTMKIGEDDFKKVNFVDTFNYLLGINVEKYLISEDNKQVIITGNKELSNGKIQKFFIVWFDNKNDVNSRFEKIVNSYKNLIEKADFIYCNHQVSNSEYTTKDIYPEFYELTFKSSK